MKSINTAMRQTLTDGGNPIVRGYPNSWMVYLCLFKFISWKIIFKWFKIHDLGLPSRKPWCSSWLVAGVHAAMKLTSGLGQLNVVKGLDDFLVKVKAKDVDIPIQWFNQLRHCQIPWGQAPPQFSIIELNLNSGLYPNHSKSAPWTAQDQPPASVCHSG